MRAISLGIRVVIVVVVAVLQTVVHVQLLRWKLRPLPPPLHVCRQTFSASLVRLISALPGQARRGAMPPRQDLLPASQCPPLSWKARSAAMGIADHAVGLFCGERCRLCWMLYCYKKLSPILHFLGLTRAAALPPLQCAALDPSGQFFSDGTGDLGPLRHDYLKSPPLLKENPFSLSFILAHATWPLNQTGDTRRVL